MNSQFHTPSLFDDVIFPDISDVAPQLDQQQAAGNLHTAQQSQRIRGMDQSYNDYSNNADPTQYTGHIDPQQQQQLLHHHMNAPQQLQHQVAPQQQHLDMQMQTAGLQTMAARKQMVPAAGGSPDGASSAGRNKPLSAYAMFFRDTVSTIKQQHPGGTFPELSRIVASMWESLDAERRAVYNKRHELACLEFINKEQAMGGQAGQQQLMGAGGPMVAGGGAPTLNNANAVMQSKPAVFTISRYNNNEMVGGYDGGHFSNGTLEVMQQQQHQDCYNVNSLMADMMPQQHAIMQQVAVEQPQPQPQQQQQTQVELLNPSNPSGVAVGVAGGNLMTTPASTTLPVAPDASTATTAAAAVVVETADSTTNSFEASDAPMTAASTQQMLTEAGSVQKCTRESCTQMAIINPDWEDEYCSNECVVLHCSNVFNGWIKANLEERKRLEAKNC